MLDEVKRSLSAIRNLQRYAQRLESVDSPFAGAIRAEVEILREAYLALLEGVPVLESEASCYYCGDIMLGASDIKPLRPQSGGGPQPAMLGDGASLETFRLESEA